MTVFQAATADPAGFVSGRFLLTGSASTLALPQLADSPAGRMESITLRPLSQGEIAGRRDSFVDTLFRSESVIDAALEPGDGVIARIVRGRYPVAVDCPAPDRRAAWFDSYVTAILQRDVRDLANIELSSLPGIPQQTLKRYIALLDAVFLVRALPAYSRNRGRRLTKAPKVIVSDSGPACFLLGVDEERLSRDRVQLGTLLEGFVILEIIKQLGWSRSAASPMHFRDHAGNEVDLVLESRDGSLVAVEVKAAATVTASDFKGMRSLATLAGSDFRRGVLLYTGDRVAPFAENMSAVPLPALWTAG